MAELQRIKHKQLDDETVRIQVDVERAELWQLIGLFSRDEPSSPASIHAQVKSDLISLRQELEWEDSWITPPREEEE